MAMLDQLLGISPWGGVRPTFEQAFPVPASDETAAVEDAAEAAARRQRRGVRHTPAPMTGAEIPGMGLMESVGMLSGGSPAAPAGSLIPSAAPVQEQMPPSTNDPMAREPEVFSGGVPIPRPRPVTPNTPASVGPTDVSSANVAPAGAPLSLSPPAPPQAQGGGIGGLLGGLLKPENAPLFLSLAGGLSGAPSLGTGMRRAFAGATPAAMVLNKERQQLTNQRETFEALKARGVPPQEAIAALRNPEMMKALIGKYFETGKAQVTDGVAWRENPKTGQVEIIKDFGTSKAPTVQELATEGGKVKRQWNPKTNAWEAIPGFEKPIADRDQRLTFSNINEMSEQGGKLAQTKAFVDTFKPDYAGYMSETVGDLRNTAARNLPGQSQSAKDRAEWWQNYQSHKNVVRNELFGSALTATEKTEFQKADINPGMQPDVIARNLARQKQIIETGIRRKVDALVEAGYSRNVAEKAFGLSGEPKPLGAGQSTEIDGITIRRVK